MQFSGAAEAELRTRNELILFSALALGVIVMILFISFQWRANSWLVLANVPFALIGSVFAIWVTGLGTSLRTVVGLVTVFGISARNAVTVLGGLLSSTLLNLIVLPALAQRAYSN